MYRAPSPTRVKKVKRVVKPKAKPSKRSSSKVSDAASVKISNVDVKESSEIDDSAIPSDLNTLHAQTALVLTMPEVSEIVDAYSRAVTCFQEGVTTGVDWGSIASSVCEGKFGASDIELVATEYQSQVHFRPSLGVVVIPRADSRGLTDYKRHKQTVRRIQGVMPGLVGAAQRALQGAEDTAENDDARRRVDNALNRIQQGPPSQANNMYMYPQAGQPGYAPQGGYAPQPGYAPLGGYAPQAGYFPQGGYVTQAGYAPQYGAQLPHQQQAYSAHADYLRRPGPGRPRKMPMPFLPPPGGAARTPLTEWDFVRDLIVAGDEWLKVLSGVVTRDSLTSLVVRAATEVFLK